MHNSEAFGEPEPVILDFQQTGLGSTPTTDDDKMPTRSDLGTMRADDLTHQTAHPISQHGISQFSACNQAVLELWLTFDLQNTQDEKFPGLAAACCFDTCEVARVLQPQGRGKAHDRAARRQRFRCAAACGA